MLGMLKSCSAGLNSGICCKDRLDSCTDDTVVCLVINLKRAIPSSYSGKFSAYVRIVVFTGPKIDASRL